MVRLSISFTEPNDEWLQNQINSKEFSSKSDVINDLIRKIRAQEQEVDFVRKKIVKAESRGFSSKSADSIRAEAQEELRVHGDV